MIITKGDWSDHLNTLELVLTKIRANGLKCNIERSCFVQTKIEYLGFWMKMTGIQPLNIKVEAIVNMTTPTQHGLKVQLDILTYLS